MSDAAYLRKFIMLKPYTDQNNANLKGYVKLEVRNGIGKTEINVDGFKEAKEEDSLKAYFITQGSNDIVKAEIGKISLKQSGKGSLKWEFNPKSVDDTGLTMEDFDVVLIESDSKDINFSQAKLTGCLKDDTNGIKDIVDKFYNSKLSAKEKSTNDIIEEVASNIEEKNNTIENINQVDEVVEDEHNVTQLKQDFTSDEIKDEFKLEQILDEDYENDKTKNSYENEMNQDGLLKNDEKVNQENEAQNIEEAINNITEENNENIINKDNEHNFPTEDMSLFIKDEEKEEQETSQEFADKIATEDVSRDINEPIVNDNEKEKPSNEGFNKEDNNMNYKLFDEKHKENINNYYGYTVNKTYNYMENAINYKNQILDYTKNILKFFERTDVLKTRLEGYTWWKIEYQSKSNYYRSFLPFHNYILNINLPYPSVFNVTATYKMIKKYKHYIFGIMEVNKDIKYYVYGIPGKFTKSEQPYGGMTGFCTWCPRKGLNREKLGYWLLHIDCLTGRNAKPLQSTPPKSN